MQEIITSHLIETYEPDAIILHGSRARGKAREHSDWDFILLYAKPTTAKNVGDVSKAKCCLHCFWGVIPDFFIHFLSFLVDSNPRTGTFVPVHANV